MIFASLDAPTIRDIMIAGRLYAISNSRLLMINTRIALLHFYGFLAIMFGGFCFPHESWAIGQAQYVQHVAGKNDFPIAQNRRAAAIYVDDSDWPGVARAAKDLQSDIGRVTQCTPSLSSESGRLAGETIIIGTVGKSRIIADLIKAGKIDVQAISGKWESFFLQVVSNPLPDVPRALIIAGSDKRGTIFGIYDLSEQIGISPSYLWTDVPAQHKDALYVKTGKYVQGPPSVKYRGIFLNDESPDLSDWVSYKFGKVPIKDNPPIPPNVANYNSQFYSKIFETILRMKGNYLWPAMWNNAFNEDDPENPRLADEYGIVMGNSHQEPMLRAQKEWDRRYQKTLGSWNYYKNPDVLKDFWREGIRRNKSFESILTIGLRGANDTPMIPGGTVPQSMALLEEIVSTQRKMIAEEMNPDVTKVPQLWCLYKEVQDYYNAGLRVPDDVTLLWADDNWGNLRRLPTEAERKRPGGAGIYYHFDYVGGPRNYKWINTVSIPKVWEQMTLAKEYGADRIWIVNVGHFKHVLLPTEFFLNLGFNAGRWTNNNIIQYTALWAAREFGPEHAGKIADIVNKYTTYNARRKPELLEPATYSLTNYREAESIVRDYNSIAAKAEEIYGKLSPEFKDAFYELVLFPTKACAQVNEMYVTAGKNAMYASQGRATTNDMADKVQQLFDADAQLMAYYNNAFAGGKWKHFMDQVHIGYTMWQDPKQNIMPKVTRIDVPQAASMGIAVEGSASAWPGAAGDPELPPIRRFTSSDPSFIDVFNRGREPFNYAIETEQPWITLSSAKGTITKEERIRVSIEWDKAPKGTQVGSIRIMGSGGTAVRIKVVAINPGKSFPLNTHVEEDGFVSINTKHFLNNKPTNQARWESIEGYGREFSAMSILPSTAPVANPPNHSPCLEYRIYLHSSAKAVVHSTFAPTLNFVPGRGLRYAISFDNEKPQVIDILPKDFDARNGNREWEDSVRNASRTIRSTHGLLKPRFHTLKIWMVDPAVVLEKIVVDLGGLKPSYLGPPQSPYNALISLSK
jgi:hypothetical protein